MHPLVLRAVSQGRQRISCEQRKLLRRRDLFPRRTF
jgi:hypothetical protein